ncbi:DUF881 domain-containing protein [Fusibacter sp. JL298sf-3]
MIKKDYWWIGIASIVLGVLIAFQMKFVQRTYLDGQTPSQKTAALVTELGAVKADREALQEELDHLKMQLDEIQVSASEESIIVKNLTDELNRYKVFAGMTKVEGGGVLLSVDNPPVDLNLSLEKNIAYDYKLLLEVMNELNSAGAEAISINEQRFVNSSEVRLAGNQVNVNGVPLSPPFIIKAIGDAKTLEGALNLRFGVVQTVREQGYYIEMKQVDTLEIPAFNGSVKMRYATPVK